MREESEFDYAAWIAQQRESELKNEQERQNRQARGQINSARAYAEEAEDSAREAEARCEELEAKCDSLQVELGKWEARVDRIVSNHDPEAPAGLVVYRNEFGYVVEHNNGVTSTYPTAAAAIDDAMKDSE